MSGDRPYLVVLTVNRPPRKAGDDVGFIGPMDGLDADNRWLEYPAAGERVARVMSRHQSEADAWAARDTLDRARGWKHRPGHGLATACLHRHGKALAWTCRHDIAADLTAPRALRRLEALIERTEKAPRPTPKRRKELRQLGTLIAAAGDARRRDAGTDAGDARHTDANA